jgi:hypothetical protein
MGSPYDYIYGEPEFNCPQCGKSYPKNTFHNCEQDNTPVKGRTHKIISSDEYNRLKYLGLIDSTERATNVGDSNYSTHVIQPWSIWLDYPELTPWDHDIIKRVLRTKTTDSRELDYKKIIHICEERLRQLSLTPMEVPHV